MSRFSPARTAGFVLGAVVAAASVVGAAGLIWLDLPGYTRSPVSVSAQPPAAASIATCAGPLLASGRDATQASLLTDAAPQAVTASSPGLDDLPATTLAAPDVQGGAGPESLTVQPDAGGERADLAAAGSSTVRADDATGFAASACTRAEMESWLVTGTGTTGSADLVVLANPGDVASLVTLSVYGASGLVQPAVGKGIVVAAGTQRVVPLSALALGEENPIVRVTAAQAPVQASLQSSLTRVLAPIGIDQSAAVGAPDTTLVIPGVAVSAAPGEQGASDVSTYLRLVAPTSEGTATVTVRGGAADGAGGADDSGGAVMTQTIPVSAGVPLRLDLGSLAIGTYTVTISSTTPVTGAVWSTTGSTAGSDFAWFTPAPALAASTLVAVAAGPTPVVTVTSETDQVVTLEAEGGGDTQQLRIAAGGSVSVAARAGATYRVTADLPIRAAVSYMGTGALAGYPVQSGDAAEAAITVYPR